MPKDMIELAGETAITLALARDGFVAIRWCLQRGEAAAAADIATALHNLPSPGNSIQKELVAKGVTDLVRQYENVEPIRKLGQYFPGTLQKEGSR